VLAQKARLFERFLAELTGKSGGVRSTPVNPQSRLGREHLIAIVTPVVSVLDSLNDLVLVTSPVVLGQVELSRKVFGTKFAGKRQFAGLLMRHLRMQV